MAKSPRGLGRGFYDIFDDNSLESKKGAGEMLRISDVEPRRDQPRKTFEREALQTLADSIAEHGVLQPIIVRENEHTPGTYEIIAGERRWRASKMAGLSEIPAIVFEGDELKAAQVSLIENIQREDLNPVEEALGYGALIERFGLTQDQVAKQVGKSRSTITNMLRLLELPKEVLELLKNGELSTGHARALLGLEDEQDMIDLASKIIERVLSVRDTENAVKRINESKEELEEEEEKVDPQVKTHMKELERRAMSTLGRKVRISRSSRKKVVELTYDNDEDLETLLLSLCGENIFAETVE
ncbi:MAG: ParB/RepB/Spo0J family partition protein [Ruminococcaceae bacterium]|nr:ParB/RepB/Spo0J family partition protein [Oscillospiraceae bacterium]